MSWKKIRQLSDGEFLVYDPMPTGVESFPLAAFILFAFYSWWFIYRFITICPTWLHWTVVIVAGVYGFIKNPDGAFHFLLLTFMFVMVSWIYPLCYFWRMD